MKTSVVILNWNTRKYLEAFLPELIRSCEGVDAEVVVADNGSSDGSVELLRKGFPSVKTLVFDTNLGFTGGYNRAISQVIADSHSEYLLLLNSDILVSPDWLSVLETFMDSHPSCAVCGPKLLALESVGGEYRRTNRFEYAGGAGGYLDKFGFPYCRGRVLSRCEEDTGQYDDARALLWVSGACLMTRAVVWNELGGLDPRFFAHQEEIDYCFRAQRASYEVWSVPESVVYHLGGGTLSNDSPFKLGLNYRNSLWMLAKNLPAVLGKEKAVRRIRQRIFIDNCASFVYLLSGQIAKYKAVRKAHREFYESGTLRSISSCPKAQIVGYQNICIILQRNKKKIYANSN